MPIRHVLAPLLVAGTLAPVTPTAPTASAVPHHPARGQLDSEPPAVDLRPSPDSGPAASSPRHRVRYDPPVDAPVVDHFRPPATRYGPGNRGLDYATVPGDPVRAVGDGEVVFAGAIAHRWYVTVLHADGLRSSLSFLDAVLVAKGDVVRRGEVVGLASDRIQLGFRRGDHYLDPAALLARRRARLVPPRSPVRSSPR